MGIAHRVFEKNKLRLHVNTSCEQQQSVQVGGNVPGLRFRSLQCSSFKGATGLAFTSSSRQHWMWLACLFPVFCLSVVVLNSANCSVIPFHGSSDSLVWSKWLNCLKSMTIIPWSCWAKLIPQGFLCSRVLQLFPSFYDHFTSFSYQDFLIVPVIHHLS